MVCRPGKLKASGSSFALRAGLRIVQLFGRRSAGGAALELSEAATGGTSGSAVAGISSLSRA